MPGFNVRRHNRKVGVRPIVVPAVPEHTEGAPAPEIPISGTVEPIAIGPEVEAPKVEPKDEIRLNDTSELEVPPKGEIHPEVKDS